MNIYSDGHLIKLRNALLHYTAVLNVKCISRRVKDLDMRHHTMIKYNRLLFTQNYNIIPKRKTV